MITEEDKKIVERISGPIADIIAFEIQSGNMIVEVSEGWPLPTANEWFKLKFHKNYKRMYSAIEYHKTNDPHYWFGEYFDKSKGFFVGTKFSSSWNCNNKIWGYLARGFIFISLIYGFFESTIEI